MGCSPWTRTEVGMTEHTHCIPHGGASLVSLPSLPATLAQALPTGRVGLPAQPSDKVVTGDLTPTY